MARILAVDDAAETLLIIRKTLKALGHDVVTAADPLEALKLLDAEPFDLVFLDIMMPKMDGLEVCRRIRLGATNSQSKVVIFSAKSDRELVQIAQRFGADYYLGKPAHISKIQEVAEKMLGS